LLECTACGFEVLCSRIEVEVFDPALLREKHRFIMNALRFQGTKNLIRTG